MEGKMEYAIRGIPLVSPKTIKLPEVYNVTREEQVDRVEEE
jgi:hypothetical protein